VNRGRRGTIDLESAALRDGRGGPVPLRGRANRCLQLLHQLRGVRHAGVECVGRGASAQRMDLPKAGAFQITERAASRLLSIGGFGLFLLGRFTGSLALSWFKAEKDARALRSRERGGHGTGDGAARLDLSRCALASFFFMSIMFPTIFALGIKGLGPQTKKASAFIVMAIVGGAIMPMLMGWLADVASMRVAFMVPLFCFAGIAAYGGLWTRLVNEHGRTNRHFMDRGSKLALSPQRAQRSQSLTGGERVGSAQSGFLPPIRSLCSLCPLW